MTRRRKQKRNLKTLIKLLFLSLPIPYLSLLWTLLVRSFTTRSIDQYDAMNWFLFGYSILTVFIFNHRHSYSIFFGQLRGIMIFAIHSYLCCLTSCCHRYKRFCKIILHFFQHRFRCRLSCKKRRNNRHLIQQVGVDLLSPVHDFITNTSISSSHVPLIFKPFTQFILNGFGWIKCLYAVHEPVISIKCFLTPEEKRKRQAGVKKLKPMMQSDDEKAQQKEAERSCWVKQSGTQDCSM